MSVRDELYLTLNRNGHEQRRAMLDEFETHPVYQRDYYASIKEYRRQVVQRLERVSKKKFFSARDYTRDPVRFLTGLRTLSYIDYSTSIKAGVHFTLCGGSIAALGSQKHQSLLDELDALSKFGCLAMTELGHGSNVAGIETRAVYDAQTREFVIHTPNEAAQKFWIGGAAEDANISVVMAQLEMNDKNQGVHAFVVELRNPDKTLKKGVLIKDNGPKLGYV
jgi:acyl-CoA oxidase